MFPPSPLMKMTLAVAGALLPLSLHAQSVVYNVPASASSAYPVMTVVEGTEYGSAIHLAGTDRDIQSATISVYSNVARSANVTLSLYAAVPEDRGYPPTGSTSPVANLRPLDTPLWTSGPQSFTLTGGGPSGLALNSLVFSGINTLVGDNLFWAVTFDDVTRPGTLFGPKLGAANSVTPSGAANDPSRIYIRAENGQWTPGTIGGSNNYALNIKLTAVPEPSVLALGAGFAFAGLISRRRRSA